MFNLHVAFCGETEQNAYHVNYICVFVLVVEAQNLEVCIHKQNYNN